MRAFERHVPTNEELATAGFLLFLGIIVLFLVFAAMSSRIEELEKVVRLPEKLKEGRTARLPNPKEGEPDIVVVFPG